MQNIQLYHNEPAETKFHCKNFLKETGTKILEIKAGEVAQAHSKPSMCIYKSKLSPSIEINQSRK